MKFIIILLLLANFSFCLGQNIYKEFRNAAIYGNVEKVTRFLKEDLSLIKVTDKYGFTVLHEVVGEHYHEMVELLINNGADVNAQNDEGIAPLHLAAYGKNAKLLIDKGAKVNIESDIGETPLYVQASEEGGFEVMIVLLENGADPNHKNIRGKTPMDTARLRGELDKVELMKKYISE